LNAQYLSYKRILSKMLSSRLYRLLIRARVALRLEKLVNHKEKTKFYFLFRLLFSPTKKFVSVRHLFVQLMSDRTEVTRRDLNKVYVRNMGALY